MDDSQRSGEQPTPVTTEPRAGRDTRDDRAARRAERRAARPAWVGGAVLIVIGIFLLAQNVGFVWLRNWWALFILIPAVGAYANAYRSYQAHGGTLTREARGSLIGGLALTLIAAYFLFDVNLGNFWPILLILGGIGLLLNALLPGDS